MMVQTEIGLLPEDWEVVQIGDIFSMPSNSIRTQNINPNEYVSTENLLPNKAGVSKYTSRIDYAFIREYKAGDSLMSNIRPYLKKIWFSDRNGGCSSDVIVFRPSKDVDSRYAYFVLSDDRIFRLAMETSIGTKMPRGDKNAIVAFPIALPKDKSEQQNIASALSSIDKLIDDLGRTIQKKQRIREGAMEELLSGKKRLPGFTEEWVENTFDELFKPYSTASYSRDDMIEGNVLCIHYGDIHTKYGPVVYLDSNEIPTITKEQAGRYTRLKDGDIIMADASEDYEGIGKCIAVITCGREAIAGLHTILLRPKANDLFDHRFTSYILSHRSTKKQIEYLSEGTKVNSISFNKIKVVTVTYPSSLKEQGTIADILTSMDDEISLLESERAKYEQIRSGMMEELLTGKKRLIKK